MKCMRLGSEQRRNFIDNMLEKDSSKGVQGQFKKVLNEKRNLLKSFKKGLISITETSKLLEALNPNFSRISVNLVRERVQTLRKLFSHLQKDKKGVLWRGISLFGFSLFSF